LQSIVVILVLTTLTLSFFMSRIGLIDVAEQAGVSVSTASRVLNKTQVTVPISDRTRKRVELAASELGYRPSAAARALRTGQTRTFGVLGNSPKAFWLWSEGDVFTSEMMRGMMEAAISHSFHMTLLTGEASVDRMPDLGMVDGILVLNRDLSETPNIVDALKGSGKPVVYLLDYPEDEACHALAPDDVEMGRLAVQTLIDAGHRRIGFARTDNWQGIFGRRERGWHRGLEEAGIACSSDWCMDVTSGDFSGVQTHGLSAVVCANSNIARVVRDATDVSVVAMVHSDADGNPPVDLAGVVFSLANIVQDGGDLLIRLIEGEAITPQAQLYTPQYIPGPTMKEVGI
jgi:DNA-binding LacI/PurR family transcriptional regulator